MLIRLIIILFLCCQSAYAVCPLTTPQSVKNIKEDIEKQLSPVREYVFFNSTPTGFIISLNNNVVFDENNELSISGKLILVQMAQIIKNSGHKWQIFCHDNKQNTQIQRISTTTEQAVKITNYLTNIESCLINQIIPIGFGSIMPIKTTSKKQSQNRIDFIVEEFKFSR